MLAMQSIADIPVGLWITLYLIIGYLFMMVLVRAHYKVFGQLNSPKVIFVLVWLTWPYALYLTIAGGFEKVRELKEKDNDGN